MNLMNIIEPKKHKGGWMRKCKLSIVKRDNRFAGLILMLMGIVFLASEGWAAKDFSVQQPDASGSKYVLIGWNDLGMHCINASYSELAILPPFNNLWVQVIQRGDPPKIVTSGFSLEYSIVNNTTVQDKTDFWQYAYQLFGVSLSPGIGLTGNGLIGKMQLAGDHFEATGIPVLPYDDKMNWNPFQIANVMLRDNLGKGNKTGKTIQVVLPVSDEINCAQCHMQGMDGTVNLTDGGTMDTNVNILMVHDYYHGAAGISSTGPDLASMQPVLCASCHSSNALGTPGLTGVKSVSLAMHGWHNPSRAPDATCYSCHPGELTQCLRTGISGMGYMGTEPSCQTGLCHGGISGMADSNRTPWVTEPNCDQCHGINYSTGGENYRHAKGHGGVYCAACHNSPHAWWPSKNWADNIQSSRLQKSPSSIGDCNVCHTNKLTGNNPHVVYYPESSK
jgi:hypothetical protein